MLWIALAYQTLVRIGNMDLNRARTIWTEFHGLSQRRVASIDLNIGRDELASF